MRGDYMKWSSHRIITGLAVYSVTMNPLQSTIIALASVLPDAIEGTWSGVHLEEWQNKHRQNSHWFVPYLLFFLILQTYILTHYIPDQLDLLFDIMVEGEIWDNLPIVARLISWLMLGACFHIAEDAICGKVPGLTMDRKVGVKLFYVGSIKEYLYVFVISAILIAIIIRHSSEMVF